MKSSKQKDQEKELFYDSRYRHKVMNGKKQKNRSSEKQHWKKAVDSCWDDEPNPDDVYLEEDYEDEP